MQSLRSYVSADGTRYHIPQNETEAFEADFGSEAQTAKRYRTKDGQSYTIPASEDEGFRADFPDAVETRQMQMADGTKREFSMPELSRFLRSKEYRESDDYKKPEQGSVAWAGLKGGAEGAVTGAYHGAKSAAGKILAALPEAAASIEEAAGNLISGVGNAPNAVGEWLRNNARAQKRWLGENIKGDVYDENGNVVMSGLEKNLGYTDNLVKLGELSGDAAAMAVKFAPAAVAGPLYTDIILASDGINAYRESYDAATQAGFGAGAANLAGAAAGLINYYGGKLLMGSGAAGNLASGPMGKFLLSGLASAGAMGMQKAGSKGVENFIQGRPGFEGQLKAFGEGAVEGGAFHLVNAVGHGWSEAMAARKETAQLKEMRKENLLTVAGEKYGGEFLNRIIQNEGMESAVKARRKGEDVSRKMGQKADLPDNMSVEERNTVVDAIIEARDAQAAANRAKISDEQSFALDEAIKEVYGTEGYEKTIRNNVLAKIKDAKVLDDPEARGRLVEEAAAEVEKAIAERDAKKPAKVDVVEEVPQRTINDLKPGETFEKDSRTYKKNENGDIVELAPDGKGKIAERPATEFKDGKEIIDGKVVAQAKKRTETPATTQQKPAENVEPPKTGNEPPKPAEGKETPSRASDETREVASIDNMNPVLKGASVALAENGSDPDNRGRRIKSASKEELQAAQKEIVDALNNPDPEAFHDFIDKMNNHGCRQRDLVTFREEWQRLHPEVDVESSPTGLVRKRVGLESDVKFASEELALHPNSKHFQAKLQEAQKKLAEFDAAHPDIKPREDAPPPKPKPDGKGKMVKAEAKNPSGKMKIDTVIALPDSWRKYSELQKRMLKTGEVMPGSEEAKRIKTELDRMNADGWGEVDSEKMKWAGADKATRGEQPPDTPAELAEWRKAREKQADKPKPDGKGKMVKPKAEKPAKVNPKKAAKVVEDFVSKDGTRKPLNNVHHDHDQGVAVASDGRVLIATKHGYDPNAKGDPDNPYPNWQQVVPKYDGATVKVFEKYDDKGHRKYVEKPVQKIEVNPVELSEICKKAIRLNKTIGVKNSANVLIPLADGERITMDAEYLKKVADAMAANGITEIKAVSGSAPILAKNGDTAIVAMPLRVNGESLKMPAKAERAGGGVVEIHALTGRIIHAPERSSSFLDSREHAESLKKSIAEGRALEENLARNSNFFGAITEAWKRGETDPKAIFDSMKHIDTTYETLKPNLKEIFDDWVKTGDADVLARKIAEYSTRTKDSRKQSPANDWLERDPKKLAKLEKRLAAEDEIDALMGESKPEKAPKVDSQSNPVDANGKPKAEGSPAEPAKGTVSDTIEELDRLIAAEEKGDSGAAGTGAEGLPARSQSWEPGKGVSRVKAFFGGLVSKNSIVRTIKDVFPEFAIRPQNTTRIGKNYSGHFEPWRELIRSKDMSSIDTIPHEIGHGISMRTKRKAMVIPQEVKRELAKMGRDLYGDLKPTSGYMEEGWAEFVRGYMTGADNLATECPALNKWFVEKFTPAHPSYVKRIDRVRKEVLRYRVQSDLQRAAAEQRPETSAVRRAWDKVTDVFSAENWDDEGATLTRGYKKSGLDKMHEWQAEFRELEKLQKKGEGNSQRAQELVASISEKVLSDPRIFASNARGTSKARTMDMMRYGITNLSGTEKIGDVVGFDANGKAIRNDNTESYRDIFRDFSNKELADWDLYAAAKIGLENYVKKGKEFGVDKASLERRVAALESEKFLDALERFTKMSRRALSVGLEAGALTPEQYKKIVGEHKYYVRTERRLAEDGAGGGKGQQNPLHKIKGSTKNIMPPRIATMMQIERQLKYFQTMKVLNMIAKDVLKAERANAEFHKKRTGQEYQIAANLPVKVANAQEAVKFGSEKLRKEVTRRMNESGVTDPNEWAGDKTAADALFDQLFNGGEDVLTVFRERPSNGKNGLVSTYIDGKLVTFELPDAKWAKYITGMEAGFDNGPSGKVWDVITAPGKLLRFGATTANPVFAAANFVRDAFHSAIMSDTGAKPMVSSVVGMVDDMLGMDAGRLFKSMGGEMSMLMGSNKEAQFKHMQNAALADNILEQIAADTSVRNPLSGILRVYTDLLSKPEMGPRVREVRGVMKKAQAAGLDREAAAWLAFAAGKDVSVDFGKHGRFMKMLNQAIPYTNAWYRGLEQFSRNLGLTKALPTQFEERGGVRAARTIGRGLLYLSSVSVANSIANMLMMDEKERRAQFNKTPREKWEYDDVLGAVRVPLPFELGAVFYAIPKAIVYEAFGDKGAVKEAIWHGLSTNLGKYSSVEDFTSGITTIAPFVDMLRNKKWDGAPIVSPHIMDAYPKDRQMWYDHSTTEIAKWVGEKMDWAPAHIDHVANTWSGGMWKRLFSPAADTTLMTQTGFATFRPRPTARRDVHDFYDFRSEAQSHYNAGTASIEDVGRLARANKLHEKLSPLFKEARELGSSGLDATDRRKRRDEIMETVFDAIHEFNVAEVDDRRGGLAKAAVALTNGVELEDAVRTKNLAVLKGVPFEEIADALRAYGREKVQTAVKNSRGYKTGRIKTHRRWEPETISRRIRLLRRALNDR